VTRISSAAFPQAKPEWRADGAAAVGYLWLAFGSSNVLRVAAKITNDWLAGVEGCHGEKGRDASMTDAA
jgi:hypothetical protein